MDKILVSGDSWTSGWPLEETQPREQFTWPNIVAKHFDAQLVDTSRAGSSNYRIYRKAVEGILDDSIDTVLVFLSSWVRWETGLSGRIHQHVVNEVDSELFKNFFNGYKQYTDSLRGIISLQNLAVNYNTKCYFLDTYKDNIYTKQELTLQDFKGILSTNITEFDNMDDQRIDKKFNKVMNLRKHINKNTFISLTSYQETISDCKKQQDHPVEDGHERIAKLVIDFIKGD